MKELNTVQKREKLNDVYALGNNGNGGAFHTYVIQGKEDSGGTFTEEVHFQNGPRASADSFHGILDTDLLEIVRHRLQCFQEGDFATRENGMALNHIEEALLWLNKRAEDRIERNVLGTMKK